MDHDHQQKGGGRVSSVIWRMSDDCFYLQMHTYDDTRKVNKIKTLFKVSHKLHQISDAAIVSKIGGCVIKSIFIIAAMLAALPCVAQSVDRAELYARYDLHDDAKREYIRVATSIKRTRNDRARAWKGLSELAKKIGDSAGEQYALQQLVRRYPTHRLAIASMTRSKKQTKNRVVANTKKPVAGATQNTNVKANLIGDDDFPLASVDYFDQAAQAIHTTQKKAPEVDKKVTDDMVLADGYQ